MDKLCNEKTRCFLLKEAWAELLSWQLFCACFISRDNRQRFGIIYVQSLSETGIAFSAPASAWQESFLCWCLMGCSLQNSDWLPGILQVESSVAENWLWIFPTMCKNFVNILCRFNLFLFPQTERGFKAEQMVEIWPCYTHITFIWLNKHSIVKIPLVHQSFKTSIMLLSYN